MFHPDKGGKQEDFINLNTAHTILTQYHNEACKSICNHISGVSANLLDNFDFDTANKHDQGVVGSFVLIAENLGWF